MLTVAEALSAVLDRARALPPVSAAARRRAGLRDRRRRRRRSRFSAVRQGAGRWLRGAGRATSQGADRWLAWARPSWPARRHRGELRPGEAAGIMTGASDSTRMRRGRDARADTKNGTGRLLDTRARDQGRPKPDGSRPRNAGRRDRRGARVDPPASAAGGPRVRRPHRGPGHSATAGRDRADRRRAGRTGPGARAGTDP